MRYFIDNEELRSEEFEENLKEDVRIYCESVFDSYLDDMNGGTIDIQGVEFLPSEVLKTMNKAEYDEQFENFFDMKFDDAIYDLETYDEAEVDGYKYRIEYKED